MFHPKMNTISESSNHQKFDIWLFAVDLVNYVFLKSSKLPSELVVDHFPAFVCRGFNKTLQTAVDSIKEAVKQVVDEGFDKFKKRNELTPGAYTKYAKDLYKTHFRQGFDAEAFLYHVVHLAYLAHRFYREGVRRAQISAVFCIAEDFRSCNLKYGLWEAFNEIAGKIACVSTGESLPAYRSRPCGVGTNNINNFESPEVDRKSKEIRSRVEINSGSSDTIDPSPKEDRLGEDLSKPEHNTGVILSSSCTTVKEVMKGNPLKASKSLTFQESFESSLDQLPTTSTLLLKTLKHDHTPNWSPEDSSGKWKRGILKRKSSNNPLEKQIFKHSPISRIKAESIKFK